MLFNQIRNKLDNVITAAVTGSVVQTQGTTVAVAGLPAPVGAVVEIERQSGNLIRGEIIGFRDSLSIVYPFQAISGIRHGNRVRLVQTNNTLRVGDGLLGRVVDAQGRTIDSRPSPALRHQRALHGTPPISVQRPRIQTPISTGIRAIDGLLPCGHGQRVGIFSGSGVGKSVTLGMMARNTSADVNVIALIGERGREVNEFLERDLGPGGAARSVVVVATSDEPAIQRVQAAATATSIAEFFRDKGKSVLLMMDSLTRFAMAQREIGLAAGEPPATRGYPPSVFALLPKLVERAGNSPLGSITAFYSVLVEGDDMNEPVADAVRGLLDGHTILSRKIASEGHYPAIDILGSISRLATELTTPDQQQAARTIRRLMATYRDNEDLVNIGAYRQGANPEVDAAIRMRPPINAFLQQTMDESCSFEEAQAALQNLANACRPKVASNKDARTPADAATETVARPPTVST